MCEQIASHSSGFASGLSCMCDMQIELMADHKPIEIEEGLHPCMKSVDHLLTFVGVTKSYEEKSLLARDPLIAHAHSAIPCVATSLI